MLAVLQCGDDHVVTQRRPGADIDDVELGIGDQVGEVPIGLGDAEFGRRGLGRFTVRRADCRDLDAGLQPPCRRVVVQGVVGADDANLERLDHDVLLFAAKRSGDCERPQAAQRWNRLASCSRRLDKVARRVAASITGCCTARRARRSSTFSKVATGTGSFWSGRHQR